MQKKFSTCIIPENSEQLLFSMKSDLYLYHCWMNTTANKFVVIKESNDFSVPVPNQLLNFTEKELKRYLLIATVKLKHIDGFLFFNEILWNKYIG